MNKISLKKSILLFSLLLALNITIGQTNRINLGIEGGYGLAYLRGTSINSDHKPVIAFCGGFFFQYSFTKTLTLRTVICGDKKGSTSTILITDGYGRPLNELKIKTKLYYATLPVLLRATFGKKYQLFFNAGPYIGYLIKQPSPDVLSLSFNFPPAFKKFDFGVTTGLGFSIPINSKMALSLEVRHNLGLYNIAAVSNGNEKSIKTNTTNLIFSLTRKLGFRNPIVK